MSKELGELIKRYRLQAGMTQTELGKVLGFSQTFVSRMEAGTHLPPHIKRLGTILEIPEGHLAPFMVYECDEVERAFLESDLPVEDQDLLLMMYGRFSNRASLEKANSYRMSMRDEES